MSVNRGGRSVPLLPPPVVRVYWLGHRYPDGVAIASGCRSFAREEEVKWG